MPAHRPARPRARALAVAVALAGVVVAAAGALAAPAAARPAGAGTRPDLAAGSAYLVAPHQLIRGRYYETVPGFADFGLTIDGALALAATGDQRPALAAIVGFLRRGGADPSGATVNTWTGLGTRFASGGAVGKEALLAEVTGQSPRRFGGHDLISALNGLVCARATGGAGSRCPAPGAYAYDSSVFDQSLGVMAQLRAGQTRAAAPAVGYLERLQRPSGAYPSLIPPGGGPDVDSTAMAVMALALVPGRAAAAQVSAGVAWIAGRQRTDGGFPGAGGVSVNSAGLAIQALTLRAGRYRARIRAALAFLAREQNRDGGFDADAGLPGSNLRATTQAVSGATGISFGTMHRRLSGGAAPAPTVTVTAPAVTPPPVTVTVTAPAAAAPTTTVTATATVTAEPSPGGTGTDPTSPSPAVAATATTRPVAVRSGDAALTRGLWWAALGVALVAAGVIAVLLRRRPSP
jgi:hypothetical protein